MKKVKHSVGTQAVICQFGRSYSNVLPAKNYLKLFLLPNSFVIYCQVFLTLLASINHTDTDTQYKYDRYLYNLVFLVHTPLSIYGLHALRLGHKLMGKNMVRNLQYGPQTQLVRGMEGSTGATGKL